VDDMGHKSNSGAYFPVLTERARGNTVPNRAARRGGTFRFSRADFCCAAKAS
jgi:hypothetical protein